MLPGFNHNIKYKDRVYHVQTEDSGEENPVVISHIFIGGNIIATKKTDYSHILGSKNMREEIKAIMENQHKEIIKELITGKYDTQQPTGTIMSEPSTPAAAIKPDSEHLQTAKREEAGTHFKPISSTGCFTVFGEGTISEESLDEIILKFLKENK